MFEGFGFQLFTKIFIALALGLVLAISGLYDNSMLAVVRPVGSIIFMNLLTMALVPLVFASILTGITSLGDIQKLNKVGTRTIIYYISTTAVAITIGLLMANFWQPGSDLDESVKAKFESKPKSNKQVKAVDKANQDRQTLFEGLQNIFPQNIMQTVSNAKPDMLQIIFFCCNLWNCFTKNRR